MQVVNGYVCKTSCDADLARQHINPADPQDDVHNPKSPNYGKPEDPHHPGKPLEASSTPAVTFGGTLARVDDAAKAADTGAAPPSSYRPYSPGQMAAATA